MIVRNTPEFQGTRVWLNDIEQLVVVEADDVAGYVVRVKTDDVGNLLHDNENWLTEKVFGKVRIELSEIAKAFAVM